MRFTALYRDGRSNYQSDFRSEADFDEWMKCNPKVRWAHLVEISTGRFIKSVFHPEPRDIQESP